MVCKIESSRGEVLIIKTEGENSVSFSWNNCLGGFLERDPSCLSWRIFVTWRCWNSFRLFISLEWFQGWGLRSWSTRHHYFRTLSNILGIGFCQYEEQYEIQVLVRLPICLPLLHQVVPHEGLGSWLNHFQSKVWSYWCGRYYRKLPCIL